MRPVHGMRRRESSIASQAARASAAGYDFRRAKNYLEMADAVRGIVGGRPGGRNGETGRPLPGSPGVVAGRASGPKRRRRDWRTWRNTPPPRRDWCWRSPSCVTTWGTAATSRNGMKTPTRLCRANRRPPRLAAGGSPGPAHHGGQPARPSGARNASPSCARLTDFWNTRRRTTGRRRAGSPRSRFPWQKNSARGRRRSGARRSGSSNAGCKWMPSGSWATSAASPWRLPDWAAWNGTRSRRTSLPRRSTFAQNLEISEAIGDIIAQVKMHSLLGACALENGDLEQALAHYQRSWELAGDPIDQCFAAIGLLRCHQRTKSPRSIRGGGATTLGPAPARENPHRLQAPIAGGAEDPPSGVAERNGENTVGPRAARRLCWKTTYQPEAPARETRRELPSLARRAGSGLDQPGSPTKPIAPRRGKRQQEGILRGNNRGQAGEAGEDFPFVPVLRRGPAEPLAVGANSVCRFRRHGR